MIRIFHTGTSKRHVGFDFSFPYIIVFLCTVALMKIYSSWAYRLNFKASTSEPQHERSSLSPDCWKARALIARQCSSDAGSTHTQSTDFRQWLSTEQHLVSWPQIFELVHLLWIFTSQNPAFFRALPLPPFNKFRVWNGLFCISVRCFFR